MTLSFGTTGETARAAGRRRWRLQKLYVASTPNVRGSPTGVGALRVARWVSEGIEKPEERKEGGGRCRPLNRAEPELRVSAGSNASRCD